MAITLPLPVRVAAGLVATGIRVVRSLPEEIPAIPVAIVGNAMKLSMKVQQEITTLATRGDELLGGIIGGRPQENPSWATFDEDKPAPAPSRGRSAAPRSASPSATPVRAPEAPPADTERPKPNEAERPTPAAAEPDRQATADDHPAPATDVAEPPAPDAIRVEGSSSDLHTPEATAMSETETTATEAAAQVSDAVIEAATHAVPGPAGPPASAPDGATNLATNLADLATEEASTANEPHTPEDPSGDGPAALPGYDGMTLAQVRGHLRDLTAEDVSTLLAYEQSGDNRAPFLTLLSNRLVTLGAADS